MAYTQKLYQVIAGLVDARLRCIKDAKHEWEAKHEVMLVDLVRNEMPSGSGFDNATKIDLERSTPDKLVFYTSYHHMNENGFYDGWTEHDVTVRPSLVHTLSISISGRDRADVKEHIHQVFYDALMTEFVADRAAGTWVRTRETAQQA